MGQAFLTVVKLVAFLLVVKTLLFVSSLLFPEKVCKNLPKSLMAAK